MNVLRTHENAVLAVLYTAKLRSRYENPRNI